MGGGDFGGIDFSKLGGGGGMPDLSSMGMGGMEPEEGEEEDESDDDIPALEGEEAGKDAAPAAAATEKKD